MRRLFACLLVAVIAVAVVATASGSGGTGDGSGDYRVRAIFDNAAAAAESEDVKVAGATVGRIEQLDVTPDRKAAVTILVSDRRFTPFHQDAHCTLRPEGVLAVKFVECDPGTAARPRLALIRAGAGRGTHLLPLARTSSPIDLDLVTNTMRQPAGRQLAILLAELGTGLAGRGADLNAVIHRADPALGETDRVLALLARQSRRLAQFADDADRVLTPLTRQRRALAAFVTGARRTADATASRSPQITASLRRLPAFLRVLRGQMAELSGLAAQGVPLLTDLGAAAPSLSRATTQLGAVARAGTPAVQRLGVTARRATPALRRTLPLVRQLGTLGRTAQPVAGGLAALTSSFDKQLGLRHLMDILYFGTNSVNGFDDVGHYARAEPLSGACSEYTAKGYYGCDAQWGPTDAAAKPITLATPATSRLLDYLLKP